MSVLISLNPLDVQKLKAFSWISEVPNINSVPFFSKTHFSTLCNSFFAMPLFLKPIFTLSLLSLNLFPSTYSAPSEPTTSSSSLKAT